MTIRARADNQGSVERSVLTITEGVETLHVDTLRLNCARWYDIYIATMTSIVDQLLKRPAAKPKRAVASYTATDLNGVHQADLLFLPVCKRILQSRNVCVLTRL